ncbi:Leucine-rich repeat-containing protein 61 [Bulinus truncatus]|nr:Leucine-rich repeat-containing protein 61 [Bulinus truncatus]
MASTQNSLDGVITKQLLKLRSCEFDIESIHTLTLKDMNLSDLGCISECLNLENLDLSNNKLTKLHKLSSLKMLKKLNLSANMVSSLDGLQTLENLQILNISGNLLGSTDVLQMISSLNNLTDLKLNDNTAGLSNPMCNTRYIPDVLIILPSVIQLDDQRIRGRGSELFDLCNEMDKYLQKGLHSIRISTNNDIDIKSEEINLAFKPEQNQRVLFAENQLSALLQDCASLSKQAVHILTKTKATQSLSLEI